MSVTVWSDELAPASALLLRSHAEALIALAARHGISELRFASAGRIVGRVADDRDAFDVSEFELAAISLLAAEVGLFADRVLTKPNVSPDLVAASPL